MVIFDINGDFHGTFSSLPNEGYLDESKWIIADFAEGESFDPSYNYSPVDGIAVKGDLIPVDLEEVAKMEADYKATQYQRDRRYPTWEEQMDMQYHDQIDGTTTWQDAIAKVKADNPKEAE